MEQNIILSKKKIGKEEKDKICILHKLLISFHRMRLLLISITKGNHTKEIICMHLDEHMELFKCNLSESWEQCITFYLFS